MSALASGIDGQPAPAVDALGESGSVSGKDIQGPQGKDKLCGVQAEHAAAGVGIG